MTIDTTDQQAITVAQEDRDAAKALWDRMLAQSPVVSRDDGAALGRDFLQAFARHRLASVSSASAEGFVLVPRVPTEAMLIAARQIDISVEEDGDTAAYACGTEARRLWDAMLSKSPEPVPATNQAGEVVDYRALLIQAGRNAGALIDDRASDAFVKFIPEEVRLKVEKLEKSNNIHITDAINLAATQPATSQEGEAQWSPWNSGEWLGQFADKVEVKMRDGQTERVRDAGYWMRKDDDRSYWQHEPNDHNNDIVSFRLASPASLTDSVATSKDSEAVREAFSGVIRGEVVNTGAWSLHLHFGRGDGARDRMRSASSLLGSIGPMPVAAILHEEEWVTVPREPTQDQLIAGNGMFHTGEVPLNIYRAMLAASPEPVPATNQAGEVRTLLIRAGMHEDCDTAIGDVPYSVAARAVAAALATQPATSREGEDRASWLRDRLLYAIQFHMWADATAAEVEEVIESLSDSDEYDANVAALVQMPKWCSPCEAQQGVDAFFATPTPPTLSEDLREGFKYYALPFAFHEAPVNGAAYIRDANGQSVAMVMWPGHPREEEDAAEAEVYAVGRAFAALAREQGQAS